MVTTTSFRPQKPEITVVDKAEKIDENTQIMPFTS